MKVLAMRHVHKAWGDLRVLNNVSLDLESGRALALCGPSGVGKSTLARIAAGLEEADSGTVERPERIAMVFQSPAGQFNPRRPLWVSIAETLLNAKLARSQAREQVAQVCERMRLDGDLLDSYPSQLSLGQLQRSALARAAVAQAQLIICDEATSALDPRATKDVLDVLAELKEEGAGILFITHDRAAAHYLCEEIMDLT